MSLNSLADLGQLMIVPFQSVQERWRTIWAMLGDRVVASVSAIPSLTDWGVSLVILAVYAAISLPLGFRLGLLQREWVTDPVTIGVSSLVALVFPSIFEEVLFRVLLLPHPSELDSFGAIALWSAISLALFVVAHPLNALVLMTARRSTFYNGTFLTLAGLLGVACTVAYLQSGSLWTAVALHWVVVVVWLLALGGDRRMGTSS